MEENKGHCTQCERDYDQIRLHVAIAHSNKAERWCEICGRLFSKSSKYKAHVSGHTDETMECHVCGKTRFKHFSSFTKHLEKHDCLHIHTCRTCSKSFAFKWNYEQHVLTEHNVIDESMDTGSLDKEVSINEGIMDSSTTEDKGHCDVCLLDFELISTHRALVHGNGTELLCNTCGRLFCTHERYADHVSRHRKKRQRCHVCKVKDFADLTSFKRHLEEHDSLHVFPCTECTRTFALGKHLKRHRRQHESTTSQTDGGVNNSNHDTSVTNHNCLIQSFNNKISKKLKYTNPNFILQTSHCEDGLQINNKISSKIQIDETPLPTKLIKNKKSKNENSLNTVKGPPQKVVIIDVSSEDDEMNTVNQDKSKGRGTIKKKNDKLNTSREMFKRNGNEENSRLESINWVDKIKSKVESNSRGDDVQFVDDDVRSKSGVVMKNLGESTSVERKGRKSVSNGANGGGGESGNWSKVGEGGSMSDEERIKGEGEKIGDFSRSGDDGRETVSHPLLEDVESSHEHDIVDRTCFKCGSVIWDGVSKHYTEIHSGNERYCHQCRKEFKKDEDFYFHMMRHADKYPWTCVACGEKHKNKYHYKLHIRTVHNKKVSYTCFECGKEFIYFDNYDSHVRLHDNKLKFKCVHCHHPFIYKQYLPVHLTKKRCESCSITFPCVSLFKKHIKSVHYYEKIFSCQHCDKKFTFETSLKRHVTSKHFDISAKSKSIVYCKHCNYLTHTLNNLSRHVKKHHTL